MNGGAYYNEFDRHKAAWLRNLAAAGHIAPGTVDDRSIRDIGPDELRGFKQCHFFAGIGIWSYALRLAGWSDDRPVWTASCPCQSFSSAGKRKGFSDERHLWPILFRLIRECRPECVFVEQVSSKDGRAWLDLVSTDLENIGYAFGTLDLPACSVGAPHIRNRYFGVAYPVDGTISDTRRGSEIGDGIARSCGAVGLPDSERDGLQGVGTTGAEAGAVGRSCEPVGLDNAEHSQSRQGVQSVEGHSGLGWCGPPDTGSVIGMEYAYVARPRRGAVPMDGQLREAVKPGGSWAECEWVYCRDNTYRPRPKPGLESVANVDPILGLDSVLPDYLHPLCETKWFKKGSGTPFENRSRAKMLAGAGDAIVAELAATFIASFMDIEI